MPHGNEIQDLILLMHFHKVGKIPKNNIKQYQKLERVTQSSGGNTITKHIELLPNDSEKHNYNTNNIQQPKFTVTKGKQQIFNVPRIYTCRFPFTKQYTRTQDIPESSEDTTYIPEVTGLL